MVRITGSVKDENSPSSPTGEFLTSVVRRSSGKSAKRMSGTESNAPTKNDPRASNTPRNERLLSSGNPESEGLDIVFSGCPARPSMQILDCPHWVCNRALLPSRTLQDPLFLVGQASNVSHEFGYIVWLVLRT